VNFLDRIFSNASGVFASSGTGCSLPRTDIATIGPISCVRRGQEIRPAPARAISLLCNTDTTLQAARLRTM